MKNAYLCLVKRLRYRISSLASGAACFPLLVFKFTSCLDFMLTAQHSVQVRQERRCCSRRLRVKGRCTRHLATLVKASVLWFVEATSGLNLRFQSINDCRATIRPTPSPAHVGLVRAPPPSRCDLLVPVAARSAGVVEERRCSLKSCFRAE